MLVRKDLPLTQQAVQACHAAIEAAREFLSPSGVHPHLVLCGVNNEATLHRETKRLEKLGIRFACFREPDRAGELTALATEPLRGEARRPMRRYQLLEEEDMTGSPRSRGPPSEVT